MNKMTVRDIDVADKRVLLRVDFNVPVDEATGAITDDSRVRAALPTINYLLERKARVILLSHFGRPKGKVVESMRLAPVAKCLAGILGREVKALNDCIGPEVEKAVADMKPGDVIMLENLRFHAGEEAGDASFARALAALGEVYINDAFGASHRAHASIAVIPQYLPAAAGFLLEKEINTLGRLVDDPAHPFTAVFGGAKVSDKVAVLQNIMGKVDCLLIGGAMAANFLRARGYATGESLVEEDNIETAFNLITDAERRNVKLLLPVDAVITRGEISAASKAETVDIDAVPPDGKIVDMGPATIKKYSHEIRESQTVFWNGPVGIEEIPQFAAGTHALARLLTEVKATTVIGGGSTSEVFYSMGLADKVTFVSTGGGASLEFLSGQELPGVAALRDKG